MQSRFRRRMTIVIGLGLCGVVGVQSFFLYRLSGEPRPVTPAPVNLVVVLAEPGAAQTAGLSRRGYATGPAPAPCLAQPDEDLGGERQILFLAASNRPELLSAVQNAELPELEAGERTAAPWVRLRCLREHEFDAGETLGETPWLREPVSHI